jgi:death-on-curing protein
MTRWIWLDARAVEAAHGEQLARFGGPEGMRDRGAFGSALARPRNLSLYGEPDAAALAASYAFGLARNHCFVDGNKRIAWLSARLFLAVNNVAIHFEIGDAIAIILSLAAGDTSEEALAAWFRERVEGR